MAEVSYNPTKVICYHCGEECSDESIHVEEKKFCCHGCKMVYEIINKVELCDYYDLNKAPGITQKRIVRNGKFAFLDDEQVKSKLLSFQDGHQAHVVFYLPQMHCSSCIWLLEHLGKVNLGIIKSEVNFLKKELTVVFEIDKTSLRALAETLTSIGYEPHISLRDLSAKKVRTYDRSRIFKIGVAGFCFGNIMMMSFPEYFSFGVKEDETLKSYFSYINLLLSLPVFFYSASEFFISSWHGLKQKFLNIDIPISLAIVITFARSVYEVVSGTGAGYMDSMSGIVFFMLVGRFFQDKTYNSLTYDRDYTSYFPLGVTVIEENGIEKQIPVSKLKKGDRIKVHSNEIVPADAILFLGNAKIDYSFVTGESLPIDKSIGEIIYAGGKQTEGAIELEVVKEVSESYLTRLWNNDSFKEAEQEKKDSFIHKLSRHFTWVLFSIAFASAVYWYFNDTSKILDAVTAVLIVACPCALLLSATFTNGSMLRVLQRYGFYAKNSSILERVADSNVIVFDKTGTITKANASNLSYEGKHLSLEQESMIRSLARQSSHPLSKAIVSAMPFRTPLPVKKFMESQGQGLSGVINESHIWLGSSEFVLNRQGEKRNGSKVYVRIDNEVLGTFTIKTKYRDDLVSVIKALKKHFRLSLISGDNSAEKETLSKVFNSNKGLLFDQLPEDKMNYIKSLKMKGDKVIMIGDGLNDAGALKESTVGIAVSDDINNFSPACDVILEGSRFSLLPHLINYCRQNRKIIIGSFILSVLYNIVGLYFAVQAELKPVIAAILMPASSLSIVLFTTGVSLLAAHALKRASKKNDLGSPLL